VAAARLDRDVRGGGTAVTATQTVGQMLDLKRTNRTCKHLRTDESGAVLVEFVLVLPLLLVFLFGMLDFGKAFNYWIDETHLANEGARYAAVNKNPGAASALSLQAWIKSQANTAELRNGGTGSIPTALEVCIDFPAGTSQIGDPVRVRITSTYSFLSVLTSQISGLTSKTMTSSSTMRLEQPPTNFTATCA
jgi:Flp pilus assembly protein TadG